MIGVAIRGRPLRSHPSLRKPARGRSYPDNIPAPLQTDGIQTEASDTRAHVSVVNWTVHVFSSRH